MSATPDPDDHDDPGWDDERWENEWDEWGALDLIERREREELQWWHWAGRLAVVGLLLPLVLGLLVAALIWIF